MQNVDYLDPGLSVNVKMKKNYISMSRGTDILPFTILIGDKRPSIPENSYWLL